MQMMETMAQMMETTVQILDLTGADDEINDADVRIEAADFGTNGADNHNVYHQSFPQHLHVHPRSFLGKIQKIILLPSITFAAFLNIRL